MCTVVVRVPEAPTEPVRMLAIRDEDPTRPWDALGPWWPEQYPGVIGVRDVRAGGAWLAAHPGQGRLAVLLNVGPPGPQPGLTSRGQVVLDAAGDVAPDPNRRTAPYALVTVEGHEVCLRLSDGGDEEVQAIPPGVHMLVNSPELDDWSIPRVARWLPQFRSATVDPGTDDWFRPWLDILEQSAELPPTNDEAIIRDNRPYGIGTLSLLMCTATIEPGSADVDYLEFERPGQWRSRFHIS